MTIVTFTWQRLVSSFLASHICPFLIIYGRYILQISTIPFFFFDFNRKVLFLRGLQLLKVSQLVTCWSVKRQYLLASLSDFNTWFYFSFQMLLIFLPFFSKDSYPYSFLKHCYILSAGWKERRISNFNRLIFMSHELGSLCTTYQNWWLKRNLRRFLLRQLLHGLLNKNP